MTEDDPQNDVKMTASVITVGEDLSSLSEDDLTLRITKLEAEIVRVRDVLSQRGNIRDAANALFVNKSNDN